MPRLHHPDKELNVRWYDTVLVESHGVYRLFGPERVGNVLLTNLDGNIGQTGSDERLRFSMIEGHILVGPQEAIKNFGVQITIGDQPQTHWIPLNQSFNLCRLPVVPVRQTWKVEIQSIVPKFDPLPVRVTLDLIKLITQ